MLTTLRRPQPEEYNTYFNTYISQVDGDDVLTNLRQAKQQTETFLRSLSIQKWDFAYAPNKWTIKEVFTHIIDTERIMAYRALRIARNDKTPLPGFEQDGYISNAHAQKRSGESIIQEYLTVRDATLSLFDNLEDEVFQTTGTASDAPFSPLALAYIIAGHEVHHLRIIEERYSM